jgi:hypothetical protein
LKEIFLNKKGWQILRLTNDDIKNIKTAKIFFKKLLIKLNRSSKLPYGFLEMYKLKPKIKRTIKEYIEINDKRIDQYGDIHPNDKSDDNNYID